MEARNGAPKTQYCAAVGGGLAQILCGFQGGVVVLPVETVTNAKPWRQYVKGAPKSVQHAMGHGTSGAKSLKLKYHPIETAFIMTYNALQGSTVERVIVVLGDLGSTGLGGMSLPKVNVAMTRVKLMAHIAIWPGTALDHLSKLEFNKVLVAWHGHYDGDGHWRASEQLLPRGTFPAAAMQAGTLERLARPALVACCKRLGVWTTGKAVAQMKEALGGAFELALAQHREAQQRGAAGAAALERLAAAAQATRDG